MNKRSAVLVAAGLVVALIAGGLALGSGVVGPEPTAAVASAGRQQPDPRVRTIKRTIKVHRPAQAGNATGGTALSAGPSASTPSWSDDSFDHEDEGDHDEHEGEFEDD
jgi:hypothetical protein